MEIRPLEPSDGAAVYLALLSDPEITAWFGPGGERTLEEAEVMAIRKAAHRTVHGFGWTVARAHWRQGIATALGRHALAEVSGRGLRSVVAYTDEGNVASRGVMAKLGMSYEKTFQDDGERHVLYRLALEP